MPVYAEWGIRCAGIPTLLLSNLPHYPSVQTLDIPADWMRRALSDLANTGALEELRAVAVGYLADPAQAHAIARWFEDLPDSHRPLFVLDPTFGDGDVGFYTNPAVVPAIREALVPLADIMTPNAFEALHLADGEEAQAGDLEPGSPPLDLGELVTRARLLMTASMRALVLTGVHDFDDDGAALIGNVIVTEHDEQGFFLPEVATHAKGLGDTFAAALVANYLDGAEIETAVQAAAAYVQQVILERSSTA